MTLILLTGMLNLNLIKLNRYINNLNPLFFIKEKILSTTTFWTNLGPYDIFHMVNMLP